MVTTNVSHVRNPIGKDTTESSSKRGAAKEKTYAVLSLISLIPHTQVVDNARKQTGFSDTQAILHQLSSSQ
jgi:hypothetical protein